MTTQTKPRGKSRLVVGALIAFFAALLSPVALGMSSVVFAYPVILTFLYAYSGIGVAMFGIVIMLASSAVFFSTPGMLISLAAFALPSAVMIRLMRWGRPFWTQTRAAICAQAAGLIGALLIAYAYIGGDLIGALVGYLRTAIEKLSPGVVDSVLNMFYDIDAVPATYSMDQLAQGFLTAEARIGYLDALTADLKTSLALTLPGALLTSSIFTGVLAVTWGNYVLRNDIQSDAAPRYVPVGLWTLPYGLVFGLIGTSLAAYICFSAKLKGFDTAFYAVHAIAMFAFKVQAVASFERRFAANGMKKWVRVLLIVAGLFIVSYLYEVYGCISAVFGSRGALKQLREARMGKDDE